MTPTNRTFIDVETGYKTRLYTSHDASKYHLIYEGQPQKIADGFEVNRWYIMTVGGHIRLSTGKTIALKFNEFYHLKDGERITHTKIEGQKKFRKI